jgi:tripartite-type tricarboxylate transporter receptor subunit TctC
LTNLAFRDIFLTGQIGIAKWEDNMKLNVKCIGAGIMALAGFAVLSPALAQDASNFPSRPVKMILPFPAGGGVDAIGRLLAKALSEKWKQPVVVENMAGATTTIATKAVIDAPADGHTIGIAVSQLAINPSLFKNLPYKNGDLQLVTQIVEAPLYVGVNPSTPGATFAELLNYAKSHPGEIKYASAGPTITNLAVEVLQQDAGAKFKEIPYIGSAQGVTATLSGEVNFTYAIYPVLKALAKEGRIKILANSDSKRSTVLPDVPSIKELVPSYAGVTEWYGVIAPKNTPRTLVDKLYRDVREALASEALKNRLTEDGSTIIASSPDEFAKFVDQQTGLWGKVTKAVGLSLDVQ